MAFTLSLIFWVKEPKKEVKMLLTCTYKHSHLQHTVHGRQQKQRQQETT